VEVARSVSRPGEGSRVRGPFFREAQRLVALSLCGKGQFSGPGFRRRPRRG
jgi:hypothetical protein